MALNRPSYSSSTWTDQYGTYWPHLGNDGDNWNCDGHQPGLSVAASDLELNPWYAVDLGVKLTIAGVMLTHRTDDIRGKSLLSNA